MSEETIIAKGTYIDGKITGEQPLEISGNVKGEITIEGKILITETGVTDATIKADEVVVEGVHSGNIEAKELIQISPAGKVKAELKAPAISIEKGAKFSGKIDMFSDDED